MRQCIMKAQNISQKCLQYLRSIGAKPILAINPGTPICVVEEAVDFIDGVLVMTVNPGFAGQKLVPNTVDKARRLRKWLDENGHEDIIIETDGNMSNENCRKAFLRSRCKNVCCRNIESC